MVPTVDMILAVVAGVSKELGGALKVKNLFGLPPAELAGRFHLVSLCGVVAGPRLSGVAGEEGGGGSGVRGPLLRLWTR